MDKEFEDKWYEVVRLVESRFGGDVDLQSIVFLIGVQELGKGYREFSKDQKVEVMHIAICTLLSHYGYYRFMGRDEEGWPHWERTKKLPHLNPAQQSKLLKRAIIEYFDV